MEDTLRTRALIALLLFTTSVSEAFPPAPHYTLYGTVRDQVGKTITDADAVLIWLNGGVEVGRTPVNSALLLDQNYELNIRIDQIRSGTLTAGDERVLPTGGEIADASATKPFNSTIL